MSGLVITADDLGMSPGVTRGILESCRDGWCEIDADGVGGWVPQGVLWGVRPGEVLD